MTIETDIKKENRGGARVKSPDKFKKRIKKQLSLDASIVEAFDKLTANEYNKLIHYALMLVKDEIIVL